MFLRLIAESLGFAWQALRENVLRTVLSLLGVTVGIFAIIAVLSVVDALEKNIKNTLSFLGDKVIYVQKMPWIFSDDYPWWKYFNRPSAKYDEYKFVRENTDRQLGVAIFDQKGGVTLKNKNNSIKGCFVQGVSEGYASVSDVPIGAGRFFTATESEAGKNIAIIGSDVAEALFPGETDILGKTFKLKGLPFVVVATLKKQGANLLGADFDNVAYIPYKTFDKLFHSKYSQPTIAAKGMEQDAGLQDLEAELIGNMRAVRGLKPSQEDNFSLNRPEMIASRIDSLFAVLNIGAFVIGGFSVLIGAFGIANIMFVSVRERTNIIGIQKALGAKNYFILFQFLFEAIFLSLFGAAIGLLLVWGITFLPLGSFALELSFKNVSLGIAIATAVGVLAGMIPAAVAARLDPVIAIRSK
jgi:putative ABC transport system permease protein